VAGTTNKIFSETYGPNTIEIFKRSIDDGGPFALLRHKAADEVTAFIQRHPDKPGARIEFNATEATIPEATFHDMHKLIPGLKQVGRSLGFSLADPVEYVYPESNPAVHQLFQSAYSNSKSLKDVLKMTQNAQAKPGTWDIPGLHVDVFNLFCEAATTCGSPDYIALTNGQYEGRYDI
jgi:hypothetical protein